MSIRRILSAVLAAAILLSTASCTIKPAPTTEEPTPTSTSQSTSDITKEEEGVKKIFVSSSASGDADGTKAKPFASLEAARDAVRALDRTGLKRIDVVLLSGTYNRQNTFLLSADDAGSKDCPIRYIGEDGAVITGGVSLRASDFAPVNETFAAYLTDDAKANVVELDLKKLGLTDDEFKDISYIETQIPDNVEKRIIFDTQFTAPSLYVNDERMQVSRWPNEGFETIRRANTLEDGTTNITYSKDVKARVANWHTKENVYVAGYPFAYWCWSYSKADIREKTSTINISTWNGYEPVVKMPFYLFNIAEELDIPGEYFIDTDGMLYFYPTDGFKNGEIKFSLAKEMFVKLEGADYVTLENITFENTRSNAIFGEANNVTVKNCTVRDTSYYGISLSGSDIRVEGCDIYSVGHLAIDIGGGDKQQLIASNNVVTNNVIHDYGELYKVYTAGVNMNGVGMEISHNEIYNSPHLAILYYSANNCNIEYNYIHDVCLNTDDAGAVYSGRTFANYGNVIRYNYFKDIGSEDTNFELASFGVHAIYFDDGLAGQTAYGNVMENITGCGTYIAAGRDIGFYDNLFINCKTALSMKSTQYDGAFSGGWFKNPAHNYEWVSAHFDIKSGPWAEAYPSLAAMKPFDENSDPNDPLLCVVPAGCVVKNNHLFSLDSTKPTSTEAHDKDFWYVAEPIKQFSEIEDPNVEWCEEGKFPSPAEALAKIGDKLSIPFDKIGVGK